MLPQILPALVMAGMASATCRGLGWETRYTATATAQVAAAAATAKTSSPVSNVKGKVFDRIAIIYFENENYAKAIGDRESFQHYRIL